MCKNSYFSNGLVYIAHTPQARPKDKSFFMKIKIIVPEATNNKWQVSIGRAHFKKREATTTYSLIEKKLGKLASSKATEIVVSVNYDALHVLKRDKHWVNEANCTTTSGALYTLAAFLEDYLPLELQREKYKKYR